MYPHQAERLGGALERAGVEALVATSPANVFYVTGFRSALPAGDPDRPVLAVFSPRGTALVLPSAEAPAAAVDGAAADHVRCYGSLFLDEPARLTDLARRAVEWVRQTAAGPEDALSAALEALGVTGRVGVDEGGLAPARWREVARRLGGRAVEAAGAFARARQVKGPWEIECLERALNVLEEAANEVIQALKPGLTEREALAALRDAVTRRGGQPRGAAVLFGERSALPAAAPADHALRPGDIVRLDAACEHRGHHARLARTAVMGEPDDAQQRAHDAVQGAVEAALEAIAPGVAARVPCERAVAAMREAGVAGYRAEEIGHGIGLEPHEPPVLAAGSAEPLETAMVLHVDVPYYRPGWGGARIRETVLVTARSHRTMNRSVRGLVLLD